MNNETYNGWTNYATWRINMETVDPAQYEYKECGRSFETVQDTEKIKNFFYYIKSKGFKMIHDTPEEFLNSNTFGAYIKKDDTIIKKLIEKIELIKKDITKGLLNEADFYTNKFYDVLNDYTFYIYKQGGSNVLYMYFNREGTYHEDWNRSRYGATINN